MLEIACPHCKRNLRIDEAHVGRMARCRFCSETFVIRRPSALRLNRMLAKSATPAAVVTAAGAYFSFSVPVAVAYFVAMVLWMILNRSKRLVPMAAAAILGPVTLGLGLVVWTMVGLGLSADAAPDGPRWLAPQQAFFLNARDLLGTAKSLSLFLFVLAAAAVVYNFWPRTDALKRVFSIKGHVGRLWLAVATVTTFTFVTGSVGTAEAGRLEKHVNQRYEAALRDRDRAHQRAETSAALLAEGSAALAPENAAVYYAVFKLGSKISASDADTVHVWVRTSAPVPERLATRVTGEAFDRLSRGTGPEDGSQRNSREPGEGSSRPPTRLTPIQAAGEWKARDLAAATLEHEARRLDAVAAQNESAAKKVLVEAAGRVFSQALHDVPFSDFISAFLKKTLDLYAGRVPPGTLFDLPRRFAHYLVSREVTRAAVTNDLEQHLLADARSQASRSQWGTALEQLEMVQRLEDPDARRAAAGLYPEYLLGRAASLRASGDLELARDAYRRILREYPRTAAQARSGLAAVEEDVVKRRVEAIGRGPHGELVRPDPLRPSGTPGLAAVEIHNRTGRALRVSIAGARSTSKRLTNGDKYVFRVPAGTYAVAAEAAGANPYHGSFVFGDSVYVYNAVIAPSGRVRRGGLGRLRRP